ncbi:MAG: zinc ribbon domain-containing protein [Clostridia bacterium]|nr:zinc ribbon domain-containing protein [Clostridia bacterium]
MADFFDKVIDGVNKGVATVSTGSKTILEKTKINTVIKTLTDEKKQLLEILGNKVYTLAVQEKKDIPLSEVEPICEQITQRLSQIAEQQAKIEALDEEMNRITGSSGVSNIVCSCGNINKSGAKFCAACGNKLS